MIAMRAQEESTGHRSSGGGCKETGLESDHYLHGLGNAPRSCGLAPAVRSIPGSLGRFAPEC